MLVSIVIWMSATQAFVPETPGLAEDGPRPAVGLEPQRVYPVHFAVQRTHARRAAWQRFVKNEGAGWHAVFDEHSGVPRSMWGRGIPMPAERNALTTALRVFVQRHSALLGLEGGELQLASAEFMDDTWYVHFDELRDGAPVYRGGISLGVKYGKLVLLQVRTSAGAPLTGAWALSPADARTLAIANGPVPTASHTDPVVERHILDYDSPTGREARRVFQVQTKTAHPPGHWVTFVDGATGELLNVHNEVRFATGTVEALHHERSPQGPFITSPVPLAFVDSGNGVATTDAAGTYTVADGETYTTTLQGEYLNVQAIGEPEGLLSAASPDLLWDDTAALQSEIDVYVFVHQVRDWAIPLSPTIDIVTDPLTANVDLNNSACNAFYDGNINFYAEGSGCNDTASNADVVYHEWGHGFHATSIQSGFFDGSLSEGIADTVAFLQTRDNIIGPDFDQFGGFVRDMAPNRIYPQDFSQFNAPHANGLIFAGTMWDLLAELEAIEGVPMGTDSLERIFAGLVRFGTDIPDTYSSALLADDDDGDLSNGTPRICAINDIFGQHGLGPGVAGLFALDHVPVEQADPNNDVRVAAAIIDATGANCVGADPLSDAVLHYRVDGGPWNDLAMTANPANPAEAEGFVPGQPVGAIVEYYVTGTFLDDRVAVPTGGEIRPFSFLVGEELTIQCWDFEADDGGFTHALLAGDPSPGADDWQWGNPAGRTTDPADAFSGDAVWGNDLGNPVGGNQFNGEYQSNKINALTSPLVETGHYTDVMVTYRRWLTIEDAFYDRAEIFSNGALVWQNRVGTGSEHHLDDQWMFHVVPLNATADQAEVEVAWQLVSDPGLEFGGWTIDDVCISAPSTPDNRLGIDDLVAEVTGDVEVRLTWTQPSHDPVERVVLVRNFEAFPIDRTDGMVIAEFENPDLDAAVTFDEVNYFSGDSYYAVYAFDGTDWLSWTIDGLNAAAVDLVGGTAPEGWPDYPDPKDPEEPADPEEPEDPETPETPDPTPPADPNEGLFASCGCSSATPAPIGAVLLTSLLVVGLRRRRD